MAEPTSGPPVVVDATGFLGMHHPDAAVRTDWKTFFVDRLGSPVLMSLEEVGRCDELVWRTPRHVQDDYYPFMDHLHTDADIRRTGYAEPDLAAAGDPELDGLDLGRRLLVGFVRRHGARLVTADPELLARPGLPVRPVPAGRADAAFPRQLESLHGRSAVLRIDVVAARREPAGAPTGG